MDQIAIPKVIGWRTRLYIPASIKAVVAVKSAFFGLPLCFKACIDAMTKYAEGI
jgi:hypothetical protein